MCALLLGAVLLCACHTAPSTPRPLSAFYVDVLYPEDRYPGETVFGDGPDAMLPERVRDELDAAIPDLDAELGRVVTLYFPKKMGVEFIRDRIAEPDGSVTISDYLFFFDEQSDGRYLRLIRRVTVDDPHNDFLKLRNVMREYREMPERMAGGSVFCVHIVGPDHVIGRSGGPPHLGWFIDPEDSKYYGDAALANVEITEMAVRLFDAAFARKQYDWPTRIFLDDMGLIPPEDRVYPEPDEESDDPAARMSVSDSEPQVTAHTPPAFEPIVTDHDRKWGRSIRRVRLVVDDRLICIEIRRPVVGYISSDPPPFRVLYSTDDPVRLEAYRRLRRITSLLVADAAAGSNGAKLVEQSGPGTTLALPDLGLDAVTSGGGPFALVLMTALDVPNAVALGAGLFSADDFEHYHDPGWEVQPAQQARETLKAIEAAHAALLFEVLAGGQLDLVVTLLLAFDNACIAD